VIESPGCRRNRLREVGDEDGDEDGDPDAWALEQRQPDDDALGNAVKDDAENDRERRALRLLALPALAIRAAHTVDDLVAEEKGRRPAEEAERDAAAPC
jgi:hypothetical protein